MAESTPPDSPPGEEDDDTSSFSHGDIPFHVLEMLNFKIVPKERGDRGYREEANWIPDDRRYYSAEFLRLSDEIDKLKMEKEEVRGRVVEGEGKLKEERRKAQEAQKRVEAESAEKLKRMEVEKEKMKAELEEVKKQLLDSRKELEGTTVQVRELRGECARQKGQLEEKDGIIEEIKKDCQEAADITKEREQEIEDYKSAIQVTRKDLEAAQKENNEQEKRLDVSEKKAAELEDKLANEQREKGKIAEELITQKEVVKTLQQELEAEKEKFKKETEGLQETIDSMDAVWAKSEQNAAKAADEYRERILGLEQKIKEVEGVRIPSNDDLEKVQKEKDDLQEKTENLREFISSLVKEFGQAIKNVQEVASSADASVTASFQQKLQQLFMYTDVTFQNLESQSGQIQEKLQEIKTVLASVVEMINTQRRNHSVEQQQQRQQQKQGLTMSTFVAPCNGRFLFDTPVGHVPQQGFSPLNSAAGFDIRPSYRDMLCRRPPDVASVPENESPLRVSANHKPTSPEENPAGSTSVLVVDLESPPDTPVAHSSNQVTPTPSHIENANVNSPETAAAEIRLLCTESIEDSDSNSNDLNPNTETETVATSSVTRERVHGVDSSRMDGYYCVCGDQNYATAASLRSHITYFTNPKKFQCPVCKQSFVYLVYLNRHLKTSHGIKKNKGVGCRLCGKSFPSAFVLHKHRKTVHNFLGSGTNVQRRDIRESSQSLLKSVPISTSEVDPPLKISLKNRPTRNGPHWNVTANSTPDDGRTEDLWETINEEDENPEMPCSSQSSQESTSRHQVSSPSSSAVPQPTTSSEVGGRSTTLDHAVDESKSPKGCVCICGRQSANKTALAKHISYHITPSWFQCTRCSRRFTGTSHLRSHMKKAHKLSFPFKGCRHCGKTFQTFKQLRDHQNSAECSKNQNTAPPKPKISSPPAAPAAKTSSFIPERTEDTSKKFRCNICDKRFRKIGELHHHFKWVHKVNNIRSKGHFGCEECGGIFSQKASLRQHRIDAHPDVPRQSVKKNGKNNLLQRALSNSQSESNVPTMATIKMEGSGQQPNAGGATPSTSTGSTSHPNFVHKKDCSKACRGKFVCTCQLKFPSKKRLNKHVNYHNAKHQFKCLLCPSKFKSTASVKKHMKKVHKKNYNLKGCTICGGLFNDLLELRKHQNLKHQKNKKIEEVDLDNVQSPVPLAEDLASQLESEVDFVRTPPRHDSRSKRLPPLLPIAQKDLLLSVSQKRHGVDIVKRARGHFCCCGAKCNDRKGLNAHIQYFTRKRQFPCHLCPRRFLYFSALKAHLRRSHKVMHFKGDDSFGCSDCGHHFSTQYDLFQHRKSVHTHNVSAASVSTSAPTPAADISSTVTTNQTQALPSSSVSGSPLRPVNPKCYPATSGNPKHGINLKKNMRQPTCLCGQQFENMKQIQCHVRSNAESVAAATGTIISKVAAAVSTVLTSSKFHKPVRLTSNPDLHVCFCGLQCDTKQQLQEHIIQEVSGIISSDSVTCETVAQSEVLASVSMETVRTDPQDAQENVQSARNRPLFQPIYSSCATAIQFDETEEHALDKSKQNSFFCICGVQFGSVDNLAAHVQYFALGRKFPCEVCKSRFSTLTDMNKHQRSKHKYKKDELSKKGCRSCGVIFASGKEISRHRVKIFSSESPNKLATVFCPSKFIAIQESTGGLAQGVAPGPAEASQVTPSTSSPTSGLAQQITSVSEPRNWISLNPSISIRCGPSTSAESAVETAAERNNVTIVPLPTQNVELNHSAADDFLRPSTSKDSLKKQIKRNTSKPKFRCKICGKKFLITSQLRAHLHSIHKMVKTDVKNGCTLCGEFFPSNMELFNHHRIVHNLGVPFEVELKYDPFVPPSPAPSIQMSQESQEIQMDTNSEQEGGTQTEVHAEVAEDPLAESREIRCTCGKTFASKGSRRTHIRTKTIGKIFVCSWCPGDSVRFDIHGNLKKHIKAVHPGVSFEKFACGTCAKTFPTLEGVLLHRKTHHDKPSPPGAPSVAGRQSDNQVQSDDATLDLNSIFDE